MSKGSIVLAYHGCDREIGERVLAGAMDLRPSDNPYDWLAEGIYLWENDAQRALHWAKSLQRNKKMSPAKINQPFVLGVIVDVGNCLDLLQAQSIGLVADAYAELKAHHAQLHVSLPVNVSIKGELALRPLDCAFIQYLHHQRQESGLTAFDTVRAAFPEGRELYPGAGFQERTHIQLCVRHSRQIVGYFRVRDQERPKQRN